MRRLSKRLGEAVSEQRLDASLIAEAWRSMDRRTVAYEPALAPAQQPIGLALFCQ